MTLLLPDLSEFQAPPDLVPGADMAGIARANGGAAIIRAAYGMSHPDHGFAAFRGAAAGFSFLGIYQYAVAGQSIISQASAFCDIVGKLGAHEVPIIDIEEGDGSQYSRVLDWNSVIASRLRKRCWIYSGEAYAEAHGLAPLFNGSAHHTWVAAYGSQEPALGHTLWQSTDGKAGSNITSWPGAGKCDTSIYHGTLGELAALTTERKHMPLTDAEITKVAQRVWGIDGSIPGPDGNPANPYWEPRRVMADLAVQVRELNAAVAAIIARLP